MKVTTLLADYKKSDLQKEQLKPGTINCFNLNVYFPTFGGWGGVMTGTAIELEEES